MITSAETYRPSALPRAIVRHRRLVVLAWSVLAAALLPAAAHVEESLDVATRIDGSESAHVDQLLAERFASPFARFAVLVAAGVPSPSSTAGRAVLDSIIAGLEGVPGVARTLSYRDAPDTMFAPASGGTIIVVGLVPGDHPVDALVPALRAATRPREAWLRTRYPGASLRWTGEVALNYDLRRTSSLDAERAERRVLPLTMLLLLIAFGTVIAALLPVAVAALAIALALGAAVAITAVTPLSLLLHNVVSMLGFGLGIDYALLMVSRFRESLRAGRSPEDAAVDATHRAGATIAISGAAVAIGFAALLWIPLGELRSIGVGGLLVVALSVLLATTLLPAVLAWLGPAVDRGRIARRERAADPSHAWRRWGRWVTGHPVRVLVIAGGPMLLLAHQARRLTADLPRGDWLPPSMESARAVNDLQAMRRTGLVQTIRIVLELPREAPLLSAAGWTATARLGEVVAGDPRVAQVRSLPVLAGGRNPHPLLLAALPGWVHRAFASTDGRLALLDVVPREETDIHELAAAVHEWRAIDVERITGVRGAGIFVGGLPAFNADYRAAVAGRLPLVIALVVGGTIAMLFVGFRSILVALKAVALNLLSVAAAFGALVLVFQDGYGAAWFGVNQAGGAVFPAIPVLVFCTVFGLSMDYEVFLIARIAEARRHGASDERATVDGLARTGSIITSAALIMIVVFAAFTLGEFLLVQMLGFALAVAVLLDATVVRLAIGPALLRLAGRWNWWPGERIPRTARVPNAALPEATV